MDFDSYERWLEENGNREEKQAIAIVSKILKYHRLNISEVKFFPRKVIKRGRERVEFDLIMAYKLKRFKVERLIGVELKESDFQKAVHQAIVRKEFVHYMYIAVREPLLRFELPSLLLMTYYGIGLLVWNDKTALLIVPSIMTTPDYIRLEQLIGKLIQAQIETMKQNKTLKDWLKV